MADVRADEIVIGCFWSARLVHIHRRDERAQIFRAGNQPRVDFAEKALDLRLRSQLFLHRRPQGRLTGAGAIQENAPFAVGAQLQRLEKDFLKPFCFRVRHAWWFI